MPDKTKHVCIIELMPIPQTIGGVPTHILELSRYLVEKGWKVSIISAKTNEKSKLKIKGVDFYYAGIPHRKLEDYNGFKKIFYLCWRFFFEAFFVIDAMKILKKLNPDIINSEGLITHALPAVFSRRKFIATAHGVHSDGFKKLYDLKGQKIFSIIFSALYYPLERLSASRAKKIVCLGKDTFEFYKRFGDCVIIPNGINEKRFYFKKQERKKEIIFVGRFTQQKRPDLLIKAMSLLPDYHLNIIGLGPLENEVKELCKSRKNCSLLGYKSQEELPILLNKANFVVLPSEFEGLPIAMLEAMACGCIPVATKVGDVGDIIQEGKNGFILKNNHADTIAEKIKMIERKYKDLEKIRANSVETAVKNYSWSIISEKYSKLYKEVIKK